VDVELDARQVRAHRVRAHQLHRTGAHEATDAAVLDLGVQDTGSDGALWALANRGVAVLSGSELVGLWRPRAAGRRLRLLVDLWGDVDRDALAAQAGRLAAFRGLTLSGVEVTAAG
jgi:hypothetical protein